MPADGEPPLLYRVTLRAMPDAVPVPARVRRLLTYALRVCRLRCVSIEGLPAPPAEEVHRARDQPLP